MAKPSSKPEVLEETGARSEIVRLIGVYSTPEYSTYHYPGRSVHYVVTFFEVKLIDTIASGHRNAESEGFAYFAPENLPANLDMVNPNWLTDALDPQASVFIR
jgi:8-oxo-dGTP diphosphatase